MWFWYFVLPVCAAAALGVWLLSRGESPVTISHPTYYYKDGMLGYFDLHAGKIVWRTANEDAMNALAEGGVTLIAPKEND